MLKSITLLEQSLYKYEKTAGEVTNSLLSSIFCQQLELHDRHMIREQSVADLSQLADKARLRKVISALKREQHNEELRKQSHPDYPDQGNSDSEDQKKAPETASTTPQSKHSGPRKSVSFGDLRAAVGVEAEEALLSDASSESSGGLILFTVSKEKEMKEGTVYASYG